MDMIQPKPFLDNFKLRNKSYGKERRLNMTKLILDKAPEFPLGVQLKDIDNEFRDWVENIDISYNGSKLPTYRLFSNQRINEYSQNWKHVDGTGNIIMNFKTITRDNNPKQGENQGGFFNIPGNRDYPMFMVSVLQENGSQAYDMYSMKQPFCIDLIYTLGLVTNKYDLLNDMNQRINFEFKSINCYIAPNHHYMPMTLEDISDESEYSIDDRKYYSQTYKIKVKAYIIREEDFKVTKVQSRIPIRLLSDSNKNKPRIEIGEEDYVADECCLREKEDPYYNKRLTVTINFPQCSNEANFNIDTDLVIRKIETDNVYDFVISVNGEYQNAEDITRMYDGDDILVKIERNEYDKDSRIVIVGFDPNSILDSNYNPESSLDEDITDEDIEYNA